MTFVSGRRVPDTEAYEPLSDRNLDRLLGERLFGWTMIMERGIGPHYRWERDKRVERVRRVELVGLPPGSHHPVVMPYWSSTGDGMMSILEAMQLTDDHWWAEIEFAGSTSGADSLVAFLRCSEVPKPYEVEATPLPRAVAMAALEALDQPPCDCAEHRWMREHPDRDDGDRGAAP